MYIYGKNVVKEVLQNKKNIKKAYVYKNFNDKEIINKLSNIDICYLEKHELDKIVNENHQGIILVVDDYNYFDIEEIIKKENSTIVILDHITDPHNFGAIIRTCEAAGVDGIIIPKDRSVQVNSTVIKVSTGAIENVKIAVKIFHFDYLFKKKNCIIIFTTNNKFFCKNISVIHKIFSCKPVF